MPILTMNACALLQDYSFETRTLHVSNALIPLPVQAKCYTCLVALGFRWRITCPS